MTQQYTPVSWQDETTSQQGTLINAERLNQMQTAHHFADGLEETDTVPTADPGVDYHKIVYCTADSTLYRWDGTQWTADIDDETKRLLEQEIARATAAESTLRGQLEDEHDARVDAEAAINDRITDEATELAQRIATETSTRYTADTVLGTRITNETSARETADTGLGNRITAEATARAEADTLLGGRIDTEQARAEAAEQANAQAIANTYTKAETDTLLGAKADKATTYTKTETDALLALKADQATTYTKAEVQTYVSNALDNYAPMVRTTGNQTIAGVKTFTEQIRSTISGVISSFYSEKSGTNSQAVIGVSTSAGSSYLLNRVVADGTSALLNINVIGSTITVDDVLTSRKDQSIIGVKTFTHNPVIYTSAFSEIGIRSARTSGNIGGISTYNSNNDPVSQIFTNVGGSLTLKLFTAGAGIVLDGQRAYDPTHPTDVATIGTLDAYTPMVRTTGNQTIQGIKTFSNKILGIVTGGDAASSESMTVGYYKSVFRIKRSNLSTFRGVASIICWQRAVGASLEFIQVAFHGNTATGIFRYGFETKTCDYFVSADTDYVYIGLKATQTTLSSTSKQMSVIATNGFNSQNIFEGYDGTASATVEGTLIAETS